MKTRSHLIHKIAVLLKDSGILDIPSLRERHPGISRVYPKLGLTELEDLADRLKTGKPLPELQKKESRYARKALLSDEEIRRLHDAEGLSYRAIALRAGISKQRVGQICKGRSSQCNE